MFIHNRVKIHSSRINVVKRLQFVGSAKIMQRFSALWNRAAAFLPWIWLFTALGARKPQNDSGDIQKHIGVCFYTIHSRLQLQSSNTFSTLGFIYSKQKQNNIFEHVERRTLFGILSGYSRRSVVCSSSYHNLYFYAYSFSACFFKWMVKVPELST